MDVDNHFSNAMLESDNAPFSYIETSTLLLDLPFLLDGCDSSPSSDSTFSDEFFSDSSPSSDYSPIFSLDSLPVVNIKEENPISLPKPSSAIKKRKPRNSKKGKTNVKKENVILNPFNPDTDSLIFSRDDILKMTSEEHDYRVNVVTSIRTLTEEEKKVVKTQTRMIKNRESANASRMRKKQQVHILEETIQQINIEKELLQSEISSLRIENASLKQQLSNQSPASSFWSIGASSESLMPQTSTSLFIILFSFGLLFAQIQTPAAKPGLVQQNTFPLFSELANSDASPKPGHVIPISSSLFRSSVSSHSVNTAHQPRGLLSHVPDSFSVLDCPQHLNLKGNSCSTNETGCIDTNTFSKPPTIV